MPFIGTGISIPKFGIPVYEDKYVYPYLYIDTTNFSRITIESVTMKTAYGTTVEIYADDDTTLLQQYKNNAWTTATEQLNWDVDISGQSQIRLRIGGLNRALLDVNNIVIS